MRAHRWRPAADLIWTKFEDSSEWVVFNPASGDIHLLTAAAHRLWALLGDGELSDAESLAAALASERGAPVDDELIDVTRDTLTFFDGAGLIRPVQP